MRLKSKENIAASRFVKLVALSPLHRLNNKPFAACPLWSKKSREYEIIDTRNVFDGISKEDKSELEKMFDPMDTYYFYPGHKLDLSTDKDGYYIKPEDVAIYAFWLTQPKCASSRRTSAMRVHDFFIDDPEIDAIKEISEASTLRLAEDFVLEGLSLSDQMELATYLGIIRVSEYSSTRILSKLLEKARDKAGAKRIMSFKSDPYKNVYILVKIAIEQQVLIRKAKGTIYYNEIPIGGSEDDAMFYLRNNPAVHRAIETAVNR